MENQPDGRDALMSLIEDHKRVLKLFERAAGDPSLFDEIRQELTLHAQLEEEILYPAMREAFPAEDREQVDLAVDDHAEVKEALGHLSELALDSDDFRQALEELRDGVSQHIEEEEDEMFPKVRLSLEPGTLADLGAQMDARRTELLAAHV